MNDNTKAWIAALLSGEYKQGQERLHKIYSDGREEFCCLGVACDLYQKAVGGLTLEVQNENGYEQVRYNTWTGALPKEVEEWLGVIGEAKQDILTEANDSGQTFEQIAQLIPTLLKEVPNEQV